MLWDGFCWVIDPWISRKGPTNTAQEMKFSIKDFSSKCDQSRSLLRIWSHLLEKSLMENFIFMQCNIHKSTKAITANEKPDLI